MPFIQLRKAVHDQKSQSIHGGRGGLRTPARQSLGAKLVRRTPGPALPTGQSGALID